MYGWRRVPVASRMAGPDVVVDHGRRRDVVEEEVGPRLLALEVLLQLAAVALHLAGGRVHGVPRLLLLRQREELAPDALQLRHRRGGHAVVHHLEEPPPAAASATRGGLGAAMSITGISGASPPRNVVAPGRSCSERTNSGGSAASDDASACTLCTSAITTQRRPLVVLSSEKEAATDVTMASQQTHASATRQVELRFKGATALAGDEMI